MLSDYAAGLNDCCLMSSGMPGLHQVAEGWLEVGLGVGLSLKGTISRGGEIAFPGDMVIPF